jgi:DNA-binding SARP family transcriptional activator
VRFRILGDLVIVADQQGVLEPGPRERRALAMLLLGGGHVVPAARLIDAIWDDRPPAHAEKQLGNIVYRLRRVLDSCGMAGQITAGMGGYRLQVADGDLDAAVFEAAVATAGQQAADGKVGEAAEQLSYALRLWRGPALAGLGGAVLEAAATALDERRLSAQATHASYLLELGRTEEAVPGLAGLVAGHPAREDLVALLMTALYRCGRQADALELYARTRTRLVRELGIEPGPRLRDLHRRVLANAPDLAAQAPPRPAEVTFGPRPEGSTGPVPRQMPAPPRHFSGRLDEQWALGEQLGDFTGGVATATIVSVISGAAGIGKTALALHWAHRVADRFADGQLHVNLRGFDPSGAPVTPAEAIRGFLDALGVPPERIPPTPEAQAGLYRSVLAGRRMLIVLDNARDEQQVRPLLPASPASLVIVTSRNQLSGLAATDGAWLLSLDVLSHDEAVQLLIARIGASRTGAEPGAIDEIAAQCARLPLALAVTAARAAARPRFPLAELAADLRCAVGRLDALDAGDPAASVRAVFSWSYEQLSADAARMFRLLGLHPGPDISVPAAASLAAVDEAQASHLLRELARDCLITEHAPGRYTFHDLLRAYAASQARDRDSQQERDAAIGRVLDHYLHTAWLGATLLAPSHEPATLAPPCPGTRPERPADHGQALAWFEAEHQVLLTAVTFAAETGADRHAWQLPWAITGYLYRRGYPHERVNVMASAVAAATRLDDALGQARSLRGLGHACAVTGSHDQARAYLERALPFYQRLDDRVGEARVQQNLAVLAEAQGRYADALGHSEQALGLFQAMSDETGEAELLTNVAWFHSLVGDYPRARACCEQSLALIAKLGGCHFEYTVEDTLGYIELHLGNFARAAEHFECALELCGDHDRFNEAEILTHLGDARHAAGDLPRARQAWQQALVIYDEIYHPDADKVREKLASAAD